MSGTHRGIGVFCAVAVALLASAAPASAATFTIDVTTDGAPDALPNNGCEAAGGNTCSLREAILKSNDTAGVRDTIQHAGNGAVLTVGTALPPIADPVDITTGNLFVGIDGPGTGSGVTGLTFGGSADTSTLTRVAVFDFSEGIALNGADGVQMRSIRVGFNSAFPGASAPNGSDISDNGIEVSNSDDVVIDDAGGSTAAIVNSFGHGIATDAASSGLRIDGATIGITPVGDAAGNGGAGVTLSGPGAVIESSRIGGNGSAGILVIDPAATGIAIRDNEIGFNAVGLPRPNESGIVIADGAATIGGPGAADGNVIGDNTFAGVELTEDGDGTVLRNNSIGFDPSSFDPVPNGASGVVVSGPGNQVGVAGSGNLIAANAGDGIRIVGTAAIDNRVEGNLVGLDQLGQRAGNGQSGINVRAGASGNVIGSPGAGNTVSDNAASGIEVDGQTTAGNVVSSNRVGTDPTGALPRGNESDGIAADDSHDNLYEQNVVAANGGDGINLDDDIFNSTIRGNVVGLNAAQTLALPNAERGIRTEGSDNLYTGNAVAGNVLNGIELDGNDDGLRIESNSIGINSAGTRTFPNGGAGIRVDSSGLHTIGGPGAQNAITANLGDGIDVTGANARATIAENSIFGNDGLGIDLAPDGVTPNDPGDPDAGPNGLQNTPTLSAVEVGGGTVVKGSISTTPATAVTVRMFSSGGCDPSGSGEGRTFLGAVSVTTDPAGAASFEVPVSAVPVGDEVTATATGPNGTSEFSPCRTAIAAPAGGGDGGGDGGGGGEPAGEEEGTEAVTCFGKEATIVGTAKAEKLKGTKRADVIAGLGGNDSIVGGKGNDRICGDGGKDSLAGGAGRDRLDGGKAADRLNGGGGKGDLCIGGPGKDKAADSCEKRKRI